MTSIAVFDRWRVSLLGDVHGCWWRVERLLRRAGWIDPAGRLTPPRGTLLLQVGDLIDRGKEMARQGAIEGETGPPLPDRVRALAADAARRVPAPGRLGGNPVSIMAVATGDLPWPEAMITHQQKLLAHACDSVATLRLFMRLEAGAEAHGSRVVCLVGNHEADLLRGRFCHARRQKIYLLALLGASSDAVVAHARHGLPPPELERLGIPELSWLLDRPVLAVGKGLLAVHGGSAGSLLTALDTLGIRDLEALGGLLDEARRAGYDHPLTEEGTSLLSPGRPEDDPFQRPVLVHRFLELAGASTLAVGHSPFLHFPRGQWVDIDDPEARRLLETPAFLGCHGEILKLDTDMKRGGPAWLVSAGPDDGTWRALREDGHELTLRRPEGGARGVLSFIRRAETPGRGSPWPPEGVGGDALAEVHGALEALCEEGFPDIADRVQRLLATLLHAGLADLSPFIHGLRWRGEALETWAAWLESWTGEVEARARELGKELEASLARGTSRDLVFVKPVDVCFAGGYGLHLLPAVVRDVLLARREREGGGAGPERIATVSYISRNGSPFLSVHVFHGVDGRSLERRVPVRDWDQDIAHVAAHVRRVMADTAHTVRVPPPSHTTGADDPATRQPARAGKLRAGKPVDDPDVRRTLETWARAARGRGDGQRAELFLALDGDDRPLRGRYLVEQGGGPAIPLLRLPGDVWVPANTSFTHPARRYPVVASGPGGPVVLDQDHPTWLLQYLEGDPVLLWSAVTSEMAARLQQGAVDTIGLSGPGRPLWQRGRFLFLSPNPAIGGYFYNKSMSLPFEVPRERLESAVSARLLTVNLFLADRGEVLDFQGRFGAPDIGLEVVAVGAGGISWILDYLDHRTGAPGRRRERPGSAPVPVGNVRKRGGRT